MTWNWPHTAPATPAAVSCSCHATGVRPPAVATVVAAAVAVAVAVAACSLQSLLPPLVPWLKVACSSWHNAAYNGETHHSLYA